MDGRSPDAGNMAGFCPAQAASGRCGASVHRTGEEIGKVVLSNVELQREISQAVAREVLAHLDGARLKLGSLEINDFSFTFPIDWRTLNGREGVYIKIPKVEVSKRQVGLVTPEDRQRGAEEYQGLVRLAQSWQAADLGVSFIQPLTFLPGYNAVVTRRVYGRDLFTVSFRQDLVHRFRGTGATGRLLDCLNRLGQALARYHRVYQEEGLFQVQPTVEKMQGYLERLEELQVDPALLAQLGRILRGILSLEVPADLTDTIKGLDIRNILIDEGCRLFLFEPGKLKRDYKEADLARFLVTCRILYWGSLWFFLRFTPHGHYEESFLEGYYGGTKPTWVLTVFTIKELLKHWLMAHRVLGLKPWPQALKKVLKWTYIDPFYREQIGAEMRKLEQEQRAGRI